MNLDLTLNTKAVLLLTSPLKLRQSRKTVQVETLAQPLTAAEYKNLARQLRASMLEPAHLLSERAEEVISQCSDIVAPERLDALLSRGFLLGQALEYWSSHGIWVMGRGDPDYPKRLKAKMKEDAPPIIYGCGDKGLLEFGGLAVVGPRDVADELYKYSYEVGATAARAGYLIVSGGARGADEAAVSGCIEAGGFGCEVLAEDLLKASIDPLRVQSISLGRLVLVTPFDPSSRFQSYNALQRNKLIYALADASLVIDSKVEKGGTWAGAFEQLKKLKYAPVYVRSSEPSSEGLQRLRQEGALHWPEHMDAAELNHMFSAALQTSTQKGSGNLFAEPTDERKNDSRPSERLFEAFLNELHQLDGAERSDDEIAALLGLHPKQVELWRNKARPTLGSSSIGRRRHQRA
jgi:DNA processing protein